MDAIGADQVTTVLLSAPPDVVAARIDAREPDLWPGKQGLIAHARRLAVTMAHPAGIDIAWPATVAVPTVMARRLACSLIVVGRPSVNTARPSSITFRRNRFMISPNIAGSLSPDLG
jgi:hypothetical protein